MTAEIKAIEEALAEPFEAHEVKFKPAVVKGNRAMALHYVDARVVQDRLDEVLGVAGWKDEYECLPDGSVVCKLSLRIGGEWVPKMDVGGQSEQPDEGDRRKAAFSDALKRAAVKWGIGRYLYRIPSGWFEYDPQKKRFVETPKLPAGSMPRKKTPAPAPASPATNSKPAMNLPANGTELKTRIEAYEARLVAQGLCKAGELVRHVLAEGVKFGAVASYANWSPQAIAAATGWVKAFEAEARKPKPAPASVQTPAPQAPAPQQSSTPSGDDEDYSGEDYEGDEPELDPAEVIGLPQRQELARLMKEAKRTWPQCCQFLKVPSATGLADLSRQQYAALRNALLNRAKENNPAPAGAVS